MTHLTNEDARNNVIVLKERKVSHLPWAFCDWTKVLMSLSVAWV